MVSKKLTRWYLEPRDAATNENAIMDLVRSCDASEDRICYGKMDNKGVEHNVVEVNRSFISLMESSTSKFNLLFRVFTQTEGEKAMKLWQFGAKKKISRTKEVVRVARRLANFVQRSVSRG